MMFKYIMFMALSAVSINSCDKEVQCDLFEYRSPVDLSYILQAYDWQQDYEGMTSVPFCGRRLYQVFPRMSSICLKTPHLCCAFLNMRILSSHSSLMPRTSITVALMHGIFTATLKYGIGAIRLIC